MGEPAQTTLRFAPSPNGELHVGHAYSALLNLKMAREIGGKMLLRIEDIDTQRCTPALEKQMLEDLEWIGFEWDEEPMRQSARFDAYADALKELNKKELLYPATLSRSDIKMLVAQKGDSWPIDPDGAPHYPGIERQLPYIKQMEILNSGVPYTLRLNMQKAMHEIQNELFWMEGNDCLKIPAAPLAWGDVVLARKDVPASYHIASVIDDAYQSITHIVRGKDLYKATSIHALLQDLLNLPRPNYHHHGLIMDEGQKLSKSNGDTSIRQLRQKGLTPADIIEMIDI